MSERSIPTIVIDVGRAALVVRDGQDLSASSSARRLHEWLLDRL